MVEVFKTNVQDARQANLLIDQIHKNFMDYKANFDLEDCDNILRVKSTTSYIEPAPVINLLQHFGFIAEVLPDE